MKPQGKLLERMKVGNGLIMYGDEPKISQPIDVTLFFRF